jgi:hypothetical protein
MILKKIKHFLVLATAVALNIGFQSCDDPYKTIDYSKLQQDEKDLLQEYLDLNLATLVSSSLDYVDNSEKSGLIYFELETGVGDTIPVGKQVSFRYTSYALLRDEKTLEPVLVFMESNIHSNTPAVYYSGNVGTPTIYSGLDEGIRYMRLFGKSKMILPSLIGLGGTSFTTLVVDVEVTHMELD